jgi:predicted RND superfamily exporter protein
MRRYMFLLIIAILTTLFYLWSPFKEKEVSDVYSEKEGRLLLPQHNVAIISLDLNEAGILFTQSKDFLLLRPLQQDLIELKGVSKVESILNVSRVISKGDDIIVTKAIPSDNSEVTNQYLEDLSSEIKDFPELSPYINEKHDTLLFYIYFANKTFPQDIYTGLNELQVKWQNSLPFEFTGQGPVIAETELLLTKDISLFFPLLVLMVILVFSLFRNIKVVLASLFLILLSIISAYGFVRFIGIQDSPLLLLIPVFSLGLLSDYLIHFFYHHLYTPRLEGKSSLRKLLMFPLSLTALSTLMGFLSLSLINGSGHLQVGLIIAVAVIVTWFGVFFWLDFGKRLQGTKHLLSGFQASQGVFFAKLARFRYVFFIAIALVMIWGGFQLKNLSIEPYPIEQLPETSTIIKSDQIINNEFYGTLPFFLEIDTGEKNGILKKDTMLKLESIHNKMEEEQIGFAYSMLTVLKRMNYYFMGDENSLLTSNEFDDFYDSLIQQYLLYYSSSVDPLEYESLLDNSYRVFSIKGLISYHNYKDLDNFLILLENIQTDFPENWSLNLHGMAKQLEIEHSNLQKNWIFSFLGGSLLIFITVLIFYR